MTVLYAGIVVSIKHCMFTTPTPPPAVKENPGKTIAQTITQRNTEQEYQFLQNHFLFFIAGQ